MIATKHRPLKRLTSSQGEPPKVDYFQQLAQLLRSEARHKINNPLGIPDPVPPDIFLNHPYYLGNLHRLFPTLQKDFINVFSDPRIVEVVETGAIGWGKSYFAALGLVRCVYEIACLGVERREILGLAPGSEVVLMNMSVTGANAKNVVYKTARFMFERSPWFKKHFPLERDIKSECRFPDNVVLRPGNSSELSAIGLNIVGGAIDEVNFFHVGKTTQRVSVALRQANQEMIEQAKVLYEAVSRRMLSRSMTGGKVFGKLFLMSSRLYEGDFTDRKCREAEANPSIYAMDYSEWDVKPHKYGKKRFWIAIGDATRPSRIEGGKFRRVGSWAERYDWVSVPMELKPLAEKDLEGFLRDMAGIVVGTVNAFIRNREAIAQAMSYKLRCPIRSYQPHIYWGPAALDKHIYWDILLKQCDPEAPHYLHFDLGLTKDALGFGMAHQVGFKEVVTAVGRDLEGSPELTEVSLPVVQLDLCLRVRPRAGEEIPLSIPFEVVSKLMEMGINVAGVTCDQYQSALPLQQIRQLGIEAERLSLDRAPCEPYKVWRDALYTGRVRMFRYAPLTGKETKPGVWKSGEFQLLVEDPTTGKVDHPPHGSKDLADGAVGAMYLALTKGGQGSIWSGEESDEDIGGGAWEEWDDEEEF